jgi:hypothetical protein
MRSNRSRPQHCISLSLSVPFDDAATPLELRFAFSQLLELFQGQSSKPEVLSELFWASRRRSAAGSRSNDSASGCSKKKVNRLPGSNRRRCHRRIEQHLPTGAIAQEAYRIIYSDVDYSSSRRAGQKSALDIQRIDKVRKRKCLGRRSQLEKCPLLFNSRLRRVVRLTQKC